MKNNLQKIVINFYAKYFVPNMFYRKFCKI